MNNPFRGTLETFLNGPDSSTSGNLCNLSLTNFSARFSSCTKHGETRAEVLPRSHQKHQNTAFFAYAFYCNSNIHRQKFRANFHHKALAQVNTFFVPASCTPHCSQVSVAQVLSFAASAFEAAEYPESCQQLSKIEVVYEIPRYWPEMQSCWYTQRCCQSEDFFKENRSAFSCPSAHFNPTATAA